MKVEKLFLVLFTFAVSCSANASGVFVFTEDSKDLKIPDKVIDVFSSGESNVNIQAVLIGEFSALDPQNLKPGMHYWLHFKALNKTSARRSWYMQAPLHSEFVDVYYVVNKRVQKEFHAGQFVPFDKRDIKVRTHVFELALDPDKPVDVYIHFYWDKYPDPSIIVSEHNRYMEVHTRGYFFIGLIYGFLILMMVYNLILYFSIREKIYLYYIFYMFAAALLLAWKDGIAFQFLWPGSPWLNNLHHRIALFLLLVGSILYTNNFLEFITKEELIKKGIRASLIVNTCYLVITFFISQYFDVLPFFYLLTYLLLLAACFYGIREGMQPAGYLVVSIGSLLAALVVIKLRYMGVLGWNWFYDHVLNFAIVVDAIVMSLAIRNKLTFFRLEREQAEQTILQAEQAKMIEEKLKLENKVIQLKNDQLEAELTHQNNELAMLVSMEAQKNEYIQRLKNDLEEVLKENPGIASLKKLVKQLDQQDDFDLRWERFRLNFDKAHNNLLNKLKMAHPNLKQTDLLFCAYLMMNKSNKELASILNITVSGVEKRHIRLKEKLQIDKEQPLLDYFYDLRKS